MSRLVNICIVLLMCGIFGSGLSVAQIGLYSNSQASGEGSVNIQGGSNIEIENSLTVPGGSIRQNSIITFSNGENATIKIMPAEASAKAILALKINNCNENNYCTIILRERKSNAKSEAVYDVEAKEKVRVLGFIKANMKVSAEVNADTGVVEKVSRPWWSFMAKSDTSASIK